MFQHDINSTGIMRMSQLYHFIAGLLLDYRYFNYHITVNIIIKWMLLNSPKYMD